MAVRLDIRPRLVLRDEPATKAPRRWRLPPLTVPAVTYWLAMAALTYSFARLGDPADESPLASEPVESVVDAAPEPALAAAPPTTLEAAAATDSSSDGSTASPPADIERGDPETEDDTEPAPASPELARRRTRDRDRDLDRDGEREVDRELASLPPSAALPAAPPPARLEFPEFTDSSPPRRAERASDGPRLDGLFPRATDPAPSRERERERERDRDGEAPSPPGPGDEGAPVVGASCEAAIARNSEHYELGAPRGPADITRGAYANVLENGRYLAGCPLPSRTVLEICAAVKGGRAVGITVSSNPPSSGLNACVRRAVSRLKFPESPRLDVTRTRFDAAR